MNIYSWLLSIFLLCMPPSLWAQQTERGQQLGMALEYFTAGKYHEALLIFERLNNKYHLNPRYIAFMGICYYYEWNYELAVKYLNSSIPTLSCFVPHERSFYYWANGESYFMLQRYTEAIPCYKEMLQLCYPNERADAYYRLGHCYLISQQWQQAYDNLQLALSAYRQYCDVHQKHARIAQIQHMLTGLLEHLPSQRRLLTPLTVLLQPKVIQLSLPPFIETHTALPSLPLLPLRIGVTSVPPPNSCGQ